MRRFFTFLFISFASLFFSQCKIGEISFALGDFLMFFNNGKVEGENKKKEIQQIAEIELEAKEKEKNILQKIQEFSIPVQQRAENVIAGNESIELLGIEKPQIKPELTNEIYFPEVARPENKIEEKDKILIEEEKREDLQIAKVNELLFYKKGQQENRNGIYNGDNFKILCAEKKKQNIICKNEQLQIISDEGSGKLEQLQNIEEEVSQILADNKGTEDEYKNLQEAEEGIKEMLKSLDKDEENGENQNIIEKKVNFQIHGKESAEVIKLRQEADAMSKILQEYKKKYEEVFKVLEEDRTYGISQIEKEEDAFPKIMELVKKIKEEGRMKTGKGISKENIDTKRREGPPEFDVDFTRKMEGIIIKGKDFKREFSDFTRDHSETFSENMRLQEDQQKLKEELYKIKENSGCNNLDILKDNVKTKENVETPRDKILAFNKYKESEPFLNDNTQKKDLRIKSGYSRDNYSIYEKKLKEDPQSMQDKSKVSRKLKFGLSSCSPLKNKNNSSPSVFDGEKFCIDQRQHKTNIRNIYDNSQRDTYLIFDGNVLNNKVRNVKVNHEISFQIHDVKEAMNLNNVKAGENKNEEQCFTKINILEKKGDILGENSRIESDETTPANTNKGSITRKKHIMGFGSNANVITGGLKKSKISTLNVRKKKGGTLTSFNAFNNKSTTSLSNSGIYREKIGGKNIINNTFEYNEIKNDLKMPVDNEKKDIKGSSQFCVKKDMSHNLNKQIYIKKRQVKEKKDTTNFSLGNNSKKNNEEGGNEALRGSLNPKTVSGARIENNGTKFYSRMDVYNKKEKEKIQKTENRDKEPVNSDKNIDRKKQQRNINRSKKSDVKDNGGGSTQNVLNNIENNKMSKNKNFIKINRKNDTSTISKNSDTNNNSNSFVLLGEKMNSVNVKAKGLEGEKNKKKADKEKDSLQEDEKDTTKTASLNGLKKK